jgi:cell division protein FtsI/penicillin-binding protein 2
MFKFLMIPIVTIFNLWFRCLLIILKFITAQSRQKVSMFLGICLFIIVSFHLANLQIFGFQELRSNKTKYKTSVIQNTVLAKRGQILINDFSKNQVEIPLTSTQILANLIIDPVEFNKVLSPKRSVSDVAKAVSANLNISFPLAQSVLNSIVGSNSRYAVLDKFVNESVQQTAKLLIEKNPDQLNYYAWLRLEEVIQRSYPEENFIGSILGYVPKFLVSKEEALKSDCKEAIETNEKRGASSGDYSIGYYGVEQKYCSILAGKNGRNMFNGSNILSQESFAVENGADITLTIDATLQKKADELLSKAIDANTNENGKPKDGALIVMEVKTGKILAMSSYPSFDPGNYSKYDSDSYRNIASSLDYEVGSTMKPLTVAAALSEYEKNTLGSQNQRLGVSPDFFKRDYGLGGKVYSEVGGGSSPSIKNSQGYSYAGDPTCCNLKKTIRDSLNTMISDIVDTLGVAKTEEYLKEKFLFNKPTDAMFAGGGSGNLSTLESQKDCLFCFAQHGFGQGFYISPIQLMRAFTAVANDGFLVEPYLVDKITYPNGVVDTGLEKNSLYPRPKPFPVLTQQASRLVTEYMKSVIDEGYLNQTGGRNKVEGYSISAKTGTAQVTRQFEGKYCDYDCNTEKGLFDHSLIGFGPSSNPEIMVMVKLSQPRPGVITNFADATSMPTFREMIKYALEYKKIPRDR